MSWLAKWRKQMLSNGIRERTPGSKTRGSGAQGTHFSGIGAPPHRWNQSWTLAQVANMDTDTNGDSEKAFLLGCPEVCLSGDGVCEGHLMQENKEMLNRTVEILPLGKAPGQEWNKMKNKSHHLQIFRSRNSGLAKLWMMKSVVHSRWGTNTSI